jgi:hypothetical protein
MDKQKQFNHWLSLIFAFVFTTIDFINSDVKSDDLLLSILAAIIVIVLYYLIARAAILVAETLFTKR